MLITFYIAFLCRMLIGGDIVSSTGGGSNQKVGGPIPPFPIPVSYTHLTLPTIYSV